MPVLSSLNLPRRQKYAIVGVFALGFGYVTLPQTTSLPLPLTPLFPSVCIISVVRLVALIDVTNLQAYDATYTSAYMIYWTTVEVNAAIACACIMTLKPLIQRVFPRLLSPSKGMREPTLQWITPANNDSLLCTHHRSSLPATSPSSPLHRHTSRGSNTSTHTHKNRGSGSGSGSGSLPHLHEYELPHAHHQDTMEKSRYYHHFTRHPSPSDTDDPYDLDHDLDLEAQRTCSTTTRADTGASSSGSAGGDYDDDEEEDHKPLDPGSASGAGALRAPPRAHLRLSVHVMREVVVESERVGPGPGAWPGRSSPSASGFGEGRNTTAGRKDGVEDAEGVELREGVGGRRTEL
jgi:hypothetical protein